ncbi:hypothetical protein CIHG_01139 [Coccidioides immitis H538.4]|uniref:Uncharacterized protein n=3 Tax=Coccidioides immitis TaxID=5501 RepID=A0A0J8QU80_COCIT|nr:hypothetical protein CIRG_03535 [Coccidioides immitis RMSCC 2394]KMU74823.1 hypothetical protein CISG_00753 [Coccidioides immitis RMSCC 3703]KMU83357.1 hypothetical protein CIHG_01139 [Coccidioides immitis H538.4]
MNCECPLNRVSNRDDEVVSMDKAANNLLQNSFSLKVLELTSSLGGKPSWVATICCSYRKRPGKPGSHDPELKETALRIPGTQDDKQEVSICRILGSLSGLNDLLLLSEINSLISAGHGSRQRKTKRQNALIHAVIDESLVRADATLVELARISAV